MVKGVIVAEKSGNRKIGNISSTTVTLKTCPNSCPFKDNGCYAQSSFVGMHVSKLNKTTSTPLELANEEAIAINSLSGKRDLRLHVAGDCTTNKIAGIVSGAAEKYKTKHNKKVYTYTHAWRNVDRSSWNSVSVLASTETTHDAKIAISKGYGASIVVSSHKDTKAYMEDGLKLLPCPQQIKDSVTCETCKLCMNDTYLRDNKVVIAFASHGTGAKKVNNALVQLGV
jgi:hypothetical protein